MSVYPKSTSEQTKGMRYFPRLLDKIRLFSRGELGEEYHANLGTPRTADNIICNFLRVNYADLRERVLTGGTDEEILEWCFEKGRRLNEGDLFVWNEFIRKFGWDDFAARVLEKRKKELGLTDRTDIQTMGQLFDIEEGRSR